jgi:hypothetical protein
MSSRRDIVIAKLREYSNIEYNDMSNLLYIYVIIVECNNYIKNNISPELYNELKINSAKAYDKYNNGDCNCYSNYYFYDKCINTVKKVIEVL